MTRCHFFVACLTAVALSAPCAKAQDALASDAPCNGNCDEAPTTRKPNRLKRVWSSICRDFKRNNSWPDPFVTADRAATRLPFDLCTANGWRIQNTLSDHHFADAGGQLTPAGRLRVAAIINESPLPYRAIFILRSSEPAVTAERVVAVQETVAGVLGDRPPVPIFETYENPRGASAYYIDEVTRRYQATIPDPRLPEGDDMSGGSSSGSSGSSGSGNN